MAHNKHAFVLRIWREDTADEPSLRGSLQAVNSREIRYFTSLSQIVEILRQMEQDEPQPPTTDESPP